MTQPTANPTTTITTFDDYQFHEIDEVNLEKLGRIWFGENFSVDNEQQFDFKFPNLVNGSPLSVETHVAVVSAVTNSFKIEANAQLVGNITITPPNNSDVLIFEKTLVAPVNVSSADVTVKITYDNNGVPNSKGYLDYIKIKAKRNLQAYGKQFPFQFDQAASLMDVVGEYQISGATSISQVWDVTDIYNVTKVENPSLSTFHSRQLWEKLETT